MKIIMLSAVCLYLPGVIYAAPGCPPHSQQINDSNSILLLGGTAKGPIKQVVVGEFGKDVNQQKRILGQFDECGALLRADISVDKNEGNMALKIVQSITRVASGWQAVYEIAVFAVKDGQPQQVSNKQGNISYRVGSKGTIISASDAFLLDGQKGFTETTNSFDGRRRLTKSVARGTDVRVNGESRYRWNAKNQLINSSSENSKSTWSYDSDAREQRLLTLTHSPTSELTTIDDCQLWDSYGNCTLSYSRETEVLPQGEIRRNISAAYRFEYWDKNGKAPQDADE
ncbi:hypothetical protein [Erwinia sp. 9145]|uniref:hypothetical protein n=1 Tax=Erwinia sp. 9145 TaxID=1500895 RepID=UPI0005518502|nr:hypothetical protein [Erwinia sp. 9145]